MGKKHRTVVTHLEMSKPPRVMAAPRPHGKYALLRAEKPPVHFYRYLYDVIGRRYAWVNRKRLSDEALTEIIHHDAVEIYVLHLNGVPAGFCELDFRRMPETAEFSFLGVMPEFIGQGLGRFLFGEGLSLIWMKNPQRVVVQTCTMDHPAALPMYQRFGFTPFAQEEAVLEELD